MHIHTLDKAKLVNEVQLGQHLNQAVEGGRRADFALMLSMLSPNPLETVPLDVDEAPTSSSQQLRSYFELEEPQPLAGTDMCYDNGAKQAHAFHNGSIGDARLVHALQPTALTFPPTGTKGMPEDIYHNLSGHERRLLPPTEEKKVHASPQDLYLSLVQARRFAEMSHCV